ncbi:MAG TPA: hypothetical protein VFM68_03560 [Candidatus Saccharimonadales bacterium]|nr:hypothetical protein [Candidatus Saccharimonadales bacterium]
MNTKPITMAEALDTSSVQHSTSQIAYSVMLGGIGLSARIASALKGYDISYHAGARPLTAQRHVRNGLFMLLHATGLSSSSYKLWRRYNKTASPYVGLTQIKTSNVAINTAVGLLITSLTTRELIAGTSLVHKHPISTYGRVITGLSLVSTIATTAQNAIELHRRKDDWLPQVRIVAAMVRSNPKSIIGRKRLRPSLDSLDPAAMEDIEKSLRKILNEQRP